MCYSLFKDLFNFSYCYSILNRYLSSLGDNNSVKISFISQTRILMANFILQVFFKYEWLIFDHTNISHFIFSVYLLLCLVTNLEKIPCGQWPLSYVKLSRQIPEWPKLQTEVMLTELKANIIIGMRLEIQAEHIKRISSNISGRDHHKRKRNGWQIKFST